MFDGNSPEKSGPSGFSTRNRNARDRGNERGTAWQNSPLWRAPICPILAMILPQVGGDRATRGWAVEDASAYLYDYVLWWPYQPLVSRRLFSQRSPHGCITWAGKARGRLLKGHFFLSPVCALVNAKTVYC